ncbi:MAG: DUF2062 domain-containing protein [Bacteroidota bacterium]
MDFFQRKLVAPLLNFLKQGLSPEKLALCVALGITIGTFPMLGSTTILCTTAALLLRLNVPAIQLINYFVYPFQLLLFIPFIRIGERLFGIPPVPLDIPLIFSMLQSDLFGTIQALWWTNVRGMIAWALIAIPIGVVVFVILKQVFIRLAAVQLSKNGS